MQCRLLSMLGARAKECHKQGEARDNVVRAIQSGAVAAGIFTFSPPQPLGKKLRDATRVWQAMNRATVSLAASKDLALSP